MTLAQALKKSIEFLQKNRIQDAVFSARALIAEATSLDQLQLLTLNDYELTGQQQDRLSSILERRALGQPINYIIGYTNFCGLKLKTDSRAIIPRQETEGLVERVIDYIKTHPTKSLIEVGTGSGAIALALNRLLSEQQIPLEIWATDISPEALELAQENKKLFAPHEKVHFIEANLLKPIDIKLTLPNSAIIIANLPYIPSERITKLEKEVRDHEPKLALDGGPDGLLLYNQLFSQIIELITQPTAIFAEIDDSHDQNLIELVQSFWPGAKVKIEPDLAGLNRYLTIELY